jgi:hypothetical protein
VLVQQQIRNEAARFAQLLGFRKPKVGLLDLCLRPLTIINIGACSVPSYDLPRFVAKSFGANEKPAINPIATPEPRLDFV